MTWQQSYDPFGSMVVSLAALVGLFVTLQAYVYPFSAMVIR